MSPYFVVERSAVARTAEPRFVCHDYEVTQTVLIVDDHPSFRASARAILEADGFEVVGEAEDGTSGLAELRRLRPDVVLLDVQLPDMSGFDVCIECGDLDTTSVVLVSSRDATDYGSLIASSGARGFIAKAELSGEAVVNLLK
jgi:DNA-binding NarL/FixJ family response regulator